MKRQRSGLLDWFSQRLNLTEIFSLLTGYGLFYAELDTRKPLREALREALEQPPPPYGRWPRVLGLVVVLLVGIEILTGGLLALYYLPTPDSAYASTGTIVREVHFGQIVHQVHYWGAQLLLAVLVVRLVRFFVQCVYCPPRELLWVFAALLLLVCFHADLSGRVLTWTSVSYWSGVRALEIAGSVPLYGSLVSFFLGGSEGALSELNLIRFYVLHAAILPAVAVGLLYLHFSTVRRVGLTEVAAESAGGSAHWFRRHLIDLAIVLALVFGALVTLASLAPVRFFAEADPYTTQPGVGPPWYLLAPFGFLELTSAVLPRWLAGLALFALFVVFVAVPFLPQRRREGGPGRGGRLVAWAVAAVVLLLWIALTLYGARVA